MTSESDWSRRVTEAMAPWWRRRDRLATEAANAADALRKHAAQAVKAARSRTTEKGMERIQAQHDKLKKAADDAEKALVRYDATHARARDAVIKKVGKRP